MIPRLAAALSLAAGGLAATPARAHHGTAAVAAIAAEEPGAALDTTSPLPLGEGTLFALARSEYVDFTQRPGFTDQKQYSVYGTVALGWGLTPWLSGFVFQPYAVKAQDGVGTNAGLGDTNLMVAASFTWDGGLRLAPERESLDDLADWHFGLWASVTLPVGPTSHVDDRGEYYAPDMQTGFRGPSPGVGLSVLKQLSPDFTALAEVSYQHFFDQAYAEAGYRYRFGGETRLNAALPWRAWASGTRRVDLVPELTLLGLARDREDGVPLPASGGVVLYGQLGVRATFGSLSVGAGLKRAVARALHEADQQQGSEGLEDFRATLAVGWSTRL